MSSAGRICVVRAGYFPDDPRVRRAVDALLDEGYEVDVVCLRGEGEPPVDRWRSAKVYRLPISHYRKGVSRYLWEYGSFLVLASLRIGRLHLGRRYDVIQVHTMPDGLVFCALFPRLTGTRVLLDMHELMPEFVAMKFRVTRASPIVRITALVERWSARFAHRVLGVSTAQAAIIEPRVGRKLDIVPNVPDAALLANAAGRSARDPNPTVITHGTMTERYGVELLLAALPLVLREEPVEALVVGDGEYLPELRGQAAALGIEEHVTFPGRVPPAELAGYIARSWAGVITLQKDGYGELCIPNKLFDYAALGVPVVAADLWAMRTYFGSDGLVYFKPGDVEDLAEKIVQVLRDERLRERVAKRALEVYDNVRWDKTSQTYLGVVRDLVEDKRGRVS